MALLNISNLSFAHPGGEELFHNVSLQLESRWKLGLTGRNGRGKTTFLKLLQGAYPFSGSITSPLAFDYFPFPVEDPAQSGRELARKLCPQAEGWELEREAALLELDADALERPFASLSGGEATKLLLALMFLRGNNFLLIDEPTNHLDLRGRELLGEYLRGKAGFILVSHDRALLDACVDHILSINRAGIELQRGNFSVWQANRARQDQYEAAEQARLKKEVSRLEESARRSADWSGRAEKGKFGNGPVDRGFIGHKAAKMMRRSKAVEARREEAVEEKSKLLRNVELSAPVTMRPLPFHSKRLLEVRGLSLYYGGKAVLQDLSFSLQAGDRLALCGKNGSGKSSLLKLLAERAGLAGLAGLKGGQGLPVSGAAHGGAACSGVAYAGATHGGEACSGAGFSGEAHSGAALSFTGELYLPPGLRISYVPQDTSFLRGRLKDFARECGVEEGLLRAVLHRLGFERPQFEADLSSYSAGQKKKVLLAASLCAEAHLYIWDEPLNYIDLISRLQIENVLLEFKPCMIFVEHDAAFVEHVATGRVDL